MKAATINFNKLLESVYSLPLEVKLELKGLLEHNIADQRRNEMFDNYKLSQQENERGELRFSESITELKKML